MRAAHEVQEVAQGVLVCRLDRGHRLCREEQQDAAARHRLRHGPAPAARAARMSAWVACDAASRCLTVSAAALEVSRVEMSASSSKILPEELAEHGSV